VSFQVVSDQAGDGLRLIGELDIAATDALLEEVDTFATRDGSRDLRIDLAELTFIDSSGIRALLKAAQRIGGNVVLLSPSPTVARILDIVRADSLPGLDIRAEGDDSPNDASTTDDRQTATDLAT
jgi:anti-sigma B factor antagonist